MIPLIAWAAGGGRWRLYVAGAVVAVAILGGLLLSWRAAIRRDERARVRAVQTAEALARAMERASTDDAIRRLPAADRRERLRAWSAPGG